MNTNDYLKVLRKVEQAATKNRLPYLFDKSNKIGIVWAYEAFDPDYAYSKLEVTNSLKEKYRSDGEDVIFIGINPKGKTFDRQKTCNERKKKFQQTGQPLYKEGPHSSSNAFWYRAVKIARQLIDDGKQLGHIYVLDLFPMSTYTIAELEQAQGHINDDTDNPIVKSIAFISQFIAHHPEAKVVIATGDTKSKAKNRQTLELLYKNIIADHEANIYHVGLKTNSSGSLYFIHLSSQKAKPVKKLTSADKILICSAIQA
ncbi:MAG: hypothetical protein ACLRX6_05320 [Limosilactobacillus pontis]|uniref:Uncharacterized protein n=1 Tax=Limosilactobacillus pontis TaxID=35787 RepID=A0A2J6NLP3_9LACO|nr:hypothetical protein [Limosilactobacillus pontis]PMB82249.1 hypothetical protein CK797_06655 [Limosilactobacillus pontis]